MQGDGTQGNPYIVTTWAEFLTATGTSNAYVELGNDIDMNEDLPEGIKENVEIRCISFDGKKYEIRNAYFTEQGCILIGFVRGIEIRNLSLINFYYNSNADGMIQTPYNITNLRLSGFFNAPNKAIITSRGQYVPKIVGMSCNVDGLNAALGDSTVWIVTVQHGIINLNHGIIKSCNFNNCYLIGSYDSINPTQPNYSNDANIIDAEIYGTLKLTYPNLCVLNEDKISDDASILTDGLIYVNSEQIADVRYLREEIGFPIGTE